MNLEAFILGTGGMMPLPRRFLTSVLLRREGDLFLFDCGEGTQVSLKMLNLRWKKINAVCISHMHADHVTGLPGMLMLSSQVDRDEPLYIYGPKRLSQYVNETKRILDMYINYEIAVVEVEGNTVIAETDEYIISCFPLNHTKPCLGYCFTEKMRPGVFRPEDALQLGIPRGPMFARLQSGETVTLEDGRVITPDQVMGSPRKGRKFTFVTDTAYSPDIAPYAADSDLFICEGMFEHHLAQTAQEKKHLTARQAGMIAAQAGGVDRMGLIHYSPRYTQRDLSLLLKEAKEEFPNSFLSRDRQRIELFYKE